MNKKDGEPSVKHQIPAQWNALTRSVSAAASVISVFAPEDDR